MSKLIIVCGLPGTGKTTHARELEAQQAVRLCPDEWMTTLDVDLYDQDARGQVENLQWELAQRLLTLGVDVVIEWGAWLRSERDVLRHRAHELGATVELHYLTAPIDVLFERVQHRNREDPPISREDLTEWSRIFQSPTAEEMDLFDVSITIDTTRPC